MLTLSEAQAIETAAQNAIAPAQTAVTDLETELANASAEIAAAEDQKKTLEDQAQGLDRDELNSVPVDPVVKQQVQDDRVTVKQRLENLANIKKTVEQELESRKLDLAGAKVKLSFAQFNVDAVQRQLTGQAIDTALTQIKTDLQTLQSLAEHQTAVMNEAGERNRGDWGKARAEIMDILKNSLLDGTLNKKVEFIGTQLL